MHAGQWAGGRRRLVTASILAAAVAWGAWYARPHAEPPRAATVLFSDCHVHLTNYIQKGITTRELLRLMGTRVERATLFGIPLQQQWAHNVSGTYAPTYYLGSDAPLYYYSFTDAFIAMAYRGLRPEEQRRFDPMITGFNPADMYAADHIRRVLTTFPGVFSGIGEFSIHKEFVSSKIAGGPPSLIDPAIDRVLAFAADVGLVVLIHNDVDQPFAKGAEPPVYLEQMRALLRRHPKANIVWAHVGVGRVVQPVENHAAMVESILGDPSLRHVSFDLSWSELAKYLVGSPETTRVAAEVLRRHPDRFIFGTDEVAPTNEADYVRVFRQYEPLWSLLDAETSAKVRFENYRRLFDEARRKVRAWERANVSEAR